MTIWGRLFGKPAIGETKPADVQNVLVEFVCMTPGCKFETLSLTTAQEHIRENLQFGTTVQSHNIEPRGYLYPPKEGP